MLNVSCALFFFSNLFLILIHRHHHSYHRTSPGRVVAKHCGFLNHCKLEQNESIKNRMALEKTEWPNLNQNAKSFGCKAAKRRLCSDFKMLKFSFLHFYFCLYTKQERTSRSQEEKRIATSRNETKKKNLHRNLK